MLRILHRKTSWWVMTTKLVLMLSGEHVSHAGFCAFRQAKIKTEHQWIFNKLCPEYNTAEGVGFSCVFVWVKQQQLGWAEISSNNKATTGEYLSSCQYGKTLCQMLLVKYDHYINYMAVDLVLVLWQSNYMSVLSKHFLRQKMCIRQKSSEYIYTVT